MENFTFIYAYSGICNHSVYIGATNDPERREKEHQSALAYNRHYNKPLQEAYDCFGADNLCMIILESIKDKSKCREKERKWIETTAKDTGLVVCNLRTYGGNTKSGYQLSEVTKQRQSRAKTGITKTINKTRAQNYEFISPDGVHVKCKGLKAVCQKHNLNTGHMSRVAKGGLKHHKGWKSANVKGDS